MTQGKSYYEVAQATQERQNKCSDAMAGIEDPKAFREAAEESNKLLKRARGIIDALMGDSDLEGDESEEFRLMQEIASAITRFEAARKGES